MNIRFLLFLLVFIAIIAGLVFYDLSRNDPWDSDVFFSELFEYAKVLVIV